MKIAGKILTIIGFCAITTGLFVLAAKVSNYLFHESTTISFISTVICFSFYSYSFSYVLNDDKNKDDRKDD